MKILAVFTGGTIGSTKYDGVISPDPASTRRLLDMYSKPDSNVEFEVVQPYNILSENLSADHLNLLCDCIKSYDLSSFDGVIVSQGTDTLQYTSAFLSYIFADCKIPIVVVSANYPLLDRRSNGFVNFCAACDFIRSKQGKGVFVAYKNCNDSFVNIHRASRLLPHSPYSDEVYSFMGQVYGTVPNRTFIKSADFFEYDNEVDLWDCKLNGIVMYIKPYVGIKFPEIGSEVKAVLLEGYHSGTLNTSGEELKQFCRRADEIGVPVFLTGSCDGFEYESKMIFDDLKIKVLPAASPIAMYMKLWLLDKENIGDVFFPCGGDFIF